MYYKTPFSNKLYLCIYFKEPNQTLCVHINIGYHFFRFTNFHLGGQQMRYFYMFLGNDIKINMFLGQLHHKIYSRKHFEMSCIEIVS